MDAIIRGSITVEILKFVLAQGSTLPSLVGALPRSVRRHRVMTVTKTLSERTDQLRCLAKEENAINGFLTLARSLWPDGIDVTFVLRLV